MIRNAIDLVKRFIPVIVIGSIAIAGLLAVGIGVADSVGGPAAPAPTSTPKPTATPFAKPTRTPPYVAPTPTPQPSNIREIGSRLEPMVDNWLMEQLQRTTLKLHSPTPREVVLEFDQPWEGSVSNYAGVIKDGDLYRMWYRALNEEENGRYTAYAESVDGIVWTRPVLGLVEANGSIENNIVLDGTDAWNLSVFKDTNPAANDSERYKAIARGPAVDGRDTIRAFVSPDGLQWQSTEQDTILVAPDDGWPNFDSHNIAFWDTEQEQYVAYMRGWINPGFRGIRRSVSDDFVEWSEPTFINLGPTKLEHLYTNAATQYYRAPHIYMMFPMRFTPDRQFDVDWLHDGLSEAVFMTSRDGQFWSRRFMEAYIPPGPDQENWNERNMVVASGLVPTGPGEMSIYYVEHYRRPTVRLRRATMRVDGIVSVNANFTGGFARTRPFNFDGNELVINYSTAASGIINVEIQDEKGLIISGYSMGNSDDIYGDEIERVVTWGGSGDLSELAGQTIRLKFDMKQADLYSLQFRNSR